METPDKKSFHHGNLHEALLGSAILLLDEGGVDAVTIRATARKAGVSHAAPVNHFRDRRALLTSMAERLFHEMYEGIVSALATQNIRVADRIKVFADALLSYGVEHPNRYRLLWRCDVLDADDEGLNVAMDAIYDCLIAELSSGVDPSQFELDTIAISLWSMCHGYVSLRLDGNMIEGVDLISGQPRLHAMIDYYLTQ